MHVISLQLQSSLSAARFRACRVFQARRDVSDLERLLISLVLTNQKSTVTNTRLGPAKVPKPGVALKYVAPYGLRDKAAYPGSFERAAWVQSPPTPMHTTCLLSAIGDLK